MFRIIDHLKRYYLVRVAVIYLRYLLGFAFVFASLVKIRGERFTRIPSTEPIGYFFEALYQSGFYWNFLGWTQFFAGALLMSQRLTFLSAIVFFPVILNIFMITHSIDFGSGTPVVTSLMLAGSVFLILSEYPKMVVFFLPDSKLKVDLTQAPSDLLQTDPVWAVTGLLFILISSVFWWFSVPVLWFAGILVLVGVLAFILGTARHRRRKSKGYA